MLLSDENQKGFCGEVFGCGKPRSNKGVFWGSGEVCGKQGVCVAEGRGKTHLWGVHN